MEKIISMLQKIKYAKNKNNQQIDNIPSDYVALKNWNNKNDDYRMHYAIGLAIACELESLKYEPVMLSSGKKEFFNIILTEDEFSKLKNTTFYKVAEENNGQRWLNFLNTKNDIKIASDTIIKIHKLYNHPNVISHDPTWVPKGLQNDLVDKYNSLG